MNKTMCGWECMKILPFLFVSFGNILIHNFVIYTYELKGPNDELGNSLLKSIDFQVVHLKKLKLLNDCDTFQKSKLFDQ